MPLYHISETPDIQTSIPRPPPNPDAGVTGDAVWAIGEYHLPHYLLPRDCPRVALHMRPDTTPEDRARLWGASKAERLMIVESCWRDRIESCCLYLYAFAPESFEVADENAGYYISRQTVTPLQCRAVSGLVQEIEKRGIELQFVDDLWPVRDAAIKSTVGFSVIRMRNAQPRAL
ncbi:MAG: hypothetical protein OXT65_02315 [Alphaproteobacteria bacterium]|nr:hypothetical protein [Alphaproteobacteria bacterium]